MADCSFLSCFGRLYVAGYYCLRPSVSFYFPAYQGVVGRRVLALLATPGLAMMLRYPSSAQPMIRVAPLSRVHHCIADAQRR